MSSLIAYLYSCIFRQFIILPVAWCRRVFFRILFIIPETSYSLHSVQNEYLPQTSCTELPHQIWRQRKTSQTVAYWIKHEHNQSESQQITITKIYIKWWQRGPERSSPFGSDAEVFGNHSTILRLYFETETTPTRLKMGSTPCFSNYKYVCLFIPNEYVKFNKVLKCRSPWRVDSTLTIGDSQNKR